MPRFKDQALCIRHYDWSETSQLVALFTREHGLVRGLAKGSKRMSPSSVARYSGGIDLLTLGEVVGIIRPSSELANLTEWDLQEPYRHLHTDLEAQRLAMFAVDLGGAMLAEHDPHPVMFDATLVLLESLRETGCRGLALLRYQWCVLTETGYKPQVDHDVRTNQALPDRAVYTFDARAGGLTAADGSEHAQWRVRRETVELLRGVAAGEALEDADGAAVGRANRLLCVYARALLDRELPTMGIVLKEV